jgi:hypothetical protein
MSGVNSISFSNAVFPSQFVSDKEKAKDKWQHDCIDGAINKVLFVHDFLRKSKKEKIENYNIVQGKFDLEKLNRHLNPMGLESDEVDDSIFSEIDGYTVLLQPLNVLFGEELKREFDPKAFVTNPEAVSLKERMIKDRITETVNRIISDPNLQEDQAQKMIEEFVKWKQYDVQTIHEQMANNIIQHFIPKQSMRTILNDSWKDLVIVGEEIVYIGEMNEEPYIRRCNPNQILYFGNGQSNRIEDATIIVEWGYYSVGALIAEFNRELTPEQLRKLETYLNMGSSTAGTLINTSPTPQYMGLEGVFLPIEDFHENPFGYNFFDKQGNILLVRVNFLSAREMLDVKYFDEFGTEQHKIMPIQYKLDKAKGEEGKKFFINEWMNGIKIGMDIYLPVRPNEIQMRSVTNPAICRPPYVGVVSNINAGKAFSIVDSIKELAYEYIVYAKKLKHLWLTNLGRIATIDMASIPNGMLSDGKKWDLSDWFRMLKTHRVALRNSFQEDGKGHISGNMTAQPGYIDMSAASEITQIMQYLEYLQDMISRLSGISPQRQGDISASQGLGTSQQAVAYSATQTEALFNLHDDFKLRVLRTFLEMAKYCLKEKKELRQYILDDSQIALLNFDGAIFAEAEYDVQVINSRRVNEFVQLMKTDILSRAVQNGTINLSDVGMAMLSNSPTAMIANLKAAEDKRRKEQQDLEQQKIKMQQEQQQMMLQLEQQKMEFEMQKLQFQRETDLMKLQMQIEDKAKSDAFTQYYQDQNNNGVEDNIELEKQELVNKDKDAQRKHDAEQEEKNRKLQLEIAKMNNQAKLDAVKLKPKTNTKS